MNPSVFSSRLCFSSRLSRFSFLGIALFLGIATLSTSAHASVLMNITESGGDVNVIGSGTLNLTALTLFANGSAGGGVLGNLAIVILGATPSIALNIDQYSGITGPASFGTGVTFIATSGTGDRFGIVGAAAAPPSLLVPAGYASGGALSGSILFTGQSFASLGLTPGTYTWNWGSGGTADSLTVQISTSAPEPGTLALLALGVVGGIALRRRK